MVKRRVNRLAEYAEIAERVGINLHELHVNVLEGIVREITNDTDKLRILRDLLNARVHEKLRNYNPECIVEHPEMFDLKWLVYGVRKLSHDDYNLAICSWWCDANGHLQLRDDVKILRGTIKEKLEYCDRHGITVEKLPCAKLKECMF